MTSNEKRFPRQLFSSCRWGWRVGVGQHGTVDIQETWWFQTEERRNWHGRLTLHTLASLSCINEWWRRRLRKSSLWVYVTTEELNQLKLYKFYGCFTQGHSPVPVSLATCDVNTSPQSLSYTLMLRTSVTKHTPVLRWGQPQRSQHRKSKLSRKKLLSWRLTMFAVTEVQPAQILMRSCCVLDTKYPF